MSTLWNVSLLYPFLNDGPMATKTGCMSGNWLSYPWLPSKLKKTQTCNFLGKCYVPYTVQKGTVLQHAIPCQAIFL